MSKNPRILIVGAGSAGISAAAHLIQHGLTNISLFEADTRIGGRIHSLKLANNYCDLGAQWCHGEKDNYVYNLCKDLNLLDSSFNRYEGLTFYEASGKIIDSNISQQLEIIFWEVLTGLENEDGRGSYGQCIPKRYYEKVSEVFGKNKEHYEIAKRLLEWFHKLCLCYDSAQHWNDISVSSNFEQCEGDQLLHWKGSGYKTVLDVLMKKIPDIQNNIGLDKKIFFKKTVNQIVWDSYKEDGNEVSVSCEDGTTAVFDHVILTVSLGVLKERVNNFFVPALPLYKQNVIESLQIGVVNKIFLKFHSKWWPHDCPGFNLTWSNDDKSNILREFDLGPVINGRSWLEDIFGFYVIDSHEDVLMGWVVGEMAHKVEEMTDDEIGLGCMYLLNKFVGDKFDISTLEKVVCSRWYTNKNFRGSYCYTSVEEKKRHANNSQLAEPLCNKNGVPTLLFAGEATHNKYFSTVHGAIETGIREANRILDLYRIKTYEVAIVGAGFAGLGAALKLIQSGVKDIIVCEAMDYVGGRIKTVKTKNDKVLELGAQWLHDSEDDLYRYAVSKNCLHDETSDEGLGIYVREDGYVYDDLLVQKVSFIVGVILESCEAFFDKNEYPHSVGEYLEEKFENYLNSQENLDEKEKQNMKQLLRWNDLFQIIDNSCLDLKDLSAKQWGTYKCLGKDGQCHSNIKGGYAEIIQSLIKELPENVIKLNTAICKIDYSNRKYVEIHCQNGIKFAARHVIVTSSIGYLKRNMHTMFVPVLPPYLRNCINAMGFNGIAKVFLEFDKKWWVCKGIQLVWENNCKINDADSWTKYITGFDEVLEQPNVLLAWVGGEGVAVMESLPEETVGLHCVKILRRFLKRDDIPNPKQVYRSKWLSCPWIKGGYSYSTPECDRLGIAPGDLSRPVYVDGIPRILLAGEAAHPHHYSTTHGAFESGQGQAEVVLKFLK